jgi:hypothetical protein
LQDWLGEDWENAVDDTSDKYYEYLMAQSHQNSLRAAGAYDAGFEAGVLATENGLGRYDG